MRKDIHLTLFISSDTHIENFVDTGILKQFRDGAHLDVIASESMKARLIKLGVESSTLPDIPKIVEKLSNFLQLVHLWKYKDRSMAHFVRAMGNFGTSVQKKEYSCVVFHDLRLSPIKSVLVKLIAEWNLLFKMFHILFSICRTVYLRGYLQTVNPDSYFLIPYGGHISAEFSTLVYVAKKQGLKSVGLQLNWDNLSTKTFMLDEPDFFAVWGAQSSSHLKTVHGFNRTKAIITGSPRFKSHFLISREIEKKDEKTSLILIAGTGDGLDDEVLIREVFQSINSNDQMQSQVVYRPHPRSRNPISSGILKAEFQNLKIDISRGYASHLELLKKASVVINHFSTLTLEGLILGCHVMVPTYLNGEAKYGYMRIKSEWLHLLALNCVPTVYFSESKEQFHTQLSALLEEPRRKSSVDWMVKDTDYVEVLLDFLKSDYSNRFDPINKL